MNKEESKKILKPEEKQHNSLKISLANVMLIIFDFVSIVSAYFLALWFRFDGMYTHIPHNYMMAYMNFIFFYAIGSLIIFGFFGLYKSIWKFASVDELVKVTEATVITGLLHVILITLLAKRMPLSYYVFGVFFQGSFTLGIRFSYRLILLVRKKHNTVKHASKRVMVIGAGEAGRQVIREIQCSDAIDEVVVCAMDGDESKWGKLIEGVPVAGGKESILDSVEKYSVEKIYFAIPTIDRKAKRDILNICSESGCEIKSLPGIYQLAKGEVSLSEMREVKIEDLLGRDQITVDMEEIFRMISGKVVLITGGGGSIGSEIALQVSRHKPKLLIIFDVYENNAYAIQHKILKENPGCNLEVLIGSVRDSRRVNDVFKKYKPDLVYHAAAHKHVPLMEDSPCEAIKNNVIGTYKVAYAAMMYGVQRFVLISTDKAVNPTNIMGASKRLCELVIQSFDKKIKANKECEIPVLYVHEEDAEGKMYPLSGTAQRRDKEGNPVFTLPGKDEKGYTKAQTEFIGVRFGNVLGSNGSVIPLFKDQIASGGPVTVTHPDIIRYFMTIPEAASLVLQAGAYAKGGELFVLDMGDPVKIVDLAKNLIRLSGLVPDVDIKIEYTGLRPGEKLYEEKLMSEEGLTKTPNDLIHIGKPVEFDEDEFLSQLGDLMLVSYENTEAIRVMVEDLVSTYNPSEPLSDKDKMMYRNEIRGILGKRVVERLDYTG